MARTKNDSADRFQRLRNRIEVLERRNAALRAEVERMAHIQPTDEVDGILESLRCACNATMQKCTLEVHQRTGRSMNFVCSITMGAMAISLADLVESWAKGNGVAVSMERRKRLLTEMREAIQRAQTDVYARKTGEIN